MDDFIPVKTSDVRRNHGAPADYDYKNVVVVASSWLLFYFVMLTGLLGNQGQAPLANIEALVPR